MGVYRRGEIWYIDYYFEDKRIREKVGPSRKEARDALGKRLAEIREGKFFDRRKEVKVRFEEFVPEFLRWSRANKLSSRSDETSMAHLIEHFKGKYLYQITSWQVEKYKAERVKVVSQVTVNRELASLKTFFNKAIQAGKARENPVKGVRFYKEQPRLRYLTREEIQRLLECSADHLRPIVETALATGMRKGEILGLRWDSIVERKGQKFIVLEKTKNGERREIPVNATMEKVLVEARRNGSPFIFCNRIGQPYGDIKHSFTTAIRKAEIEGFRFHDLRHTFASHLVMEGVDLATVKYLMGHKSFEMTLRYAHLAPEHKQKAVKIMDSVIYSHKSVTKPERIARAIALTP